MSWSCSGQTNAMLIQNLEAHYQISSKLLWALPRRSLLWFFWLTCLFSLPLLAVPNPLAWHCSGESNDALVQNLAAANIIQTDKVKTAMLAVDRGNYAPQDAYADRPQPIGYGATISAPHMHATALEILADRILQKGSRVLDVGSGSGYLAACIARMQDPEGKTIGIDYIQELVDLSVSNFMKGDADLLQSKKVVLQKGDGWKGYPEEAPYDAIHVGAAAATIPLKLVEQLKPGGVMVIPVGHQGEAQTLYKVVKNTKTGLPLSESFEATRLMGVIYVPLVQGV